MEHLLEMTRAAEFWVLVGFVLFVSVTWNPLRKMINSQVLAHIAKVQTILSEAESLRADAAAVLAKAQTQYENIEAECEAILTRTEKEAEALLNKAEAECARIIAVHRAAAADNLAQAEAQTRAELRMQAGELVLTAARGVMQKQMEGRLASALIDQAIAKLPSKLTS